MIRGKSHTPFETEITRRKGSNPYAMKLKQQQYIVAVFSNCDYDNFPLALMNTDIKRVCL